MLFDKGPDRVSPFFITQMVGGHGVGLRLDAFGARGPNFATVSACATGAQRDRRGVGDHPRGDATRDDRRGRRGRHHGDGRRRRSPTCTRSRAATTIPSSASRPFDAERDGFVLGEGAGIVVLEELELRPRARRATSTRRSSATPRPPTRTTSPSRRRAATGWPARCARALKKAELAPDAGGVHQRARHLDALQRPRRDGGDQDGLRRARASKLAVSSTKSMTGHMVGAAGGVEAAITALALHHGILPPTINYSTPIPSATSTTCPTWRARRTSRSRCRTRWASAATTPCSCSSATRSKSWRARRNKPQSAQRVTEKNPEI